MTGNVIEFAVAVIMAGAVSGVVKSFVSDIIMPIIGYFTGGQNFSNKYKILGDSTETYETLAAAREAGENVIAYGVWVNTIINLLIVGFVMFMLVRAYNKMKKAPEAAAPAGPSNEEKLLMEIRDSLKK